MWPHRLPDCHWSYPLAWEQRFLISALRLAAKCCLLLLVDPSLLQYFVIMNSSLSGGASGKEPTCQCRRHKRCSSIPMLGRSLGGGCGNPLQYSCLDNPMDRGAWWATVHGIAELETNERLVDGETVETVTLYFWGLQNHCIWCLQP